MAELTGGTADPGVDAAGPPDSTHPTLAVADGSLLKSSIVLVAVLASLYALSWARAVVVPVLLGLTFSYALTPAVNALVRWHLPRSIASVLVLAFIVGGIGSVTWSISDDAAAMVDALPEVAQKFRREVTRQRGQGAASAITQVQKAAAEIESAAADPALSPSSARVTRVQIGYTTVVLFVTFFLLASGDVFRRKMVKIAGPDFGSRRLTLGALQEINHHIQRYLVVQLFTSALVGLAVWLTFWWLGVDNAPVWGALAFVLNLIPYFGNVVLTGAAALFAFVQFGSLSMALAVGGAALVINVLESNLLTPWLTVRASRLNPVAVFVGVLAWGWLWGLGGLFLGMPILIAIKAVCDRVDEFKAVGELLGD
jgi:predicted PurR-regulated permease PerM